MAGEDRAAPAPPRRRGRRRIVLLAGLVAAAAAVAAGVRFHRAAPTGGDVPLLRADPAPERERPAEPGGMEVPWRDVLALHELGDPGAGEPVVERLLPPPETPLPKPAPAADGETETPTVRMTPLPPPGDAAPPAEEPREEEAAAALDEPPEEPAAEEAREEEAVAAIGEPPEAPSTEEPREEEAAVTIEELLEEHEEKSPAVESIPVAAAAAPPRGFSVQLGAWSTREAADAGWTRARGMAPDLLASVERFVVESAGPDGAGTLHRLRVGPLPGFAAAESLCDRLHEAGVACVVVAP